MDTRGYGTVLVNRRTGREKIDKGGASATTNNLMELTADIKGLDAVRPGAYVTWSATLNTSSRLPRLERGHGRPQGRSWARRPDTR